MSRNSKHGCRHANRRREGGYILLTLIFFVGILAIAATAVTPMITFRIRRDREEEMIHRGVQYSRAVRRYFKKFGRYPVRLEDLESTNNLRFLRRRYKDPITGQDFKLLHFGDVKLTFGGGIPPATVVRNEGPGGAAAQPASGGGAPQAGLQVANVPPVPVNAEGENNQNPAQPAGSASPLSPKSPQQENGPASPSGDSLSGKVFGGGPIVGVVSTSEKETIREFNNKSHYNEWQFIYDPSSDRGGLLNTPSRPPLQVAGPNTQSGQPPTPNGIGPVTNPGNPSPTMSPPPGVTPPN